MNKIIKSFILIFLSAFVLVGCNSNETVEEDLSVQTVEISSLKGATTIGLAKMIDDHENNDENIIIDNKKVEYNFEQFGLAEEVVTKLMKGETDLATIPANLASTLYNKSDGDIQVVSINTLGVLYMVENGNSVNSIEDLSGKTVYSVGKGITPEGVLSLFIQGNQLEDVKVEYKSEASEIAALLKTESDIIAMLPEPFVSVVKKGNRDIRTIFDMNEEWEKLNNGNSMVTGVLVGRREFLEENSDILEVFLKEYEDSMKFAQTEPEETGEIVESMGIIPEGIGRYSIPNCNISFIKGEEMKSLLQDYLTNLYNFKADLVGGSIPKEDFYY